MDIRRHMRFSAAALTIALSIASASTIPTSASAAPPIRAGSAAAPTPTISPQPGTPDASPDTQISILGPAPRTIESVTVTGSASGVHAGRLEAYSGGRGASFVLDRPLTAGESVRVLVRIRGQAPRTSSFTVATPGVVLPLL